MGAVDSASLIPEPPAGVQPDGSSHMRQVTLTGTSTEGATYGIAYSTNLAGWCQYVIESLPAATESATTTYTFPPPGGRE